MIVNVRLSDTDSFTQEVIDNPPNVDSTIRMGGYLKPVNLRDSDGHTFPSAHREALFIATYLR